MIYPTLQFDIGIPPDYTPSRPNLRKRDEFQPMGGASGHPNLDNSPKSAGKISKLFGGLANCDEQITPDCLRALYNIVYVPVATEKNSYGIVEYTPSAYLQDDLDIFFRNLRFFPAFLFSTTRLSEFIILFSTRQVQKTPTLVSIDGGTAVYMRLIYSLSHEYV